MKKFSKLAAILAVCAFIFGGLLVSCSPHGTGYGLDDVQPICNKFLNGINLFSRQRPDCCCIWIFCHVRIVQSDS